MEDSQANNNDDGFINKSLARLMDNSAVPVLNPEDDESRMNCLTEDEHELALQIQDILQHPELDPLSDYWCAQMAIVCGEDNVDVAVEHAENLQTFRETYGIVDSWEFGVQCIAEYQKLCPRHLLSISLCQGSYVVVTDMSKVDAKAIRKKPRGYDILLRFGYFMVQALNCDLKGIQRGAVVLHECRGHGLGGINFKTFRHLFTHLFSFYPKRLQKVKFFHSGLSMNLVVSMVRPFMPPQGKKKLVMGCQHDPSLDQIFNQPSPEIAEKRLLKQFEQLLKRRYQNEKNFSLG